MKNLELNRMESTHGGEYMPCGQAVIMGAMVGQMFGGLGGLFAAGVLLGPNCLDIFGQNPD